MEDRSRDVRVTITMESLLRVVLIGFIVWFLYGIRSVLAILLAALVFSSAFNPWVDRMQRRGVPRLLAILVIFVLFFAVVSLIIVLFIPALVREVRDLASSFPTLFDRLSESKSFSQFLGNPDVVEGVKKSLQSIDQALVKVTGPVFSGLASIFGGLFSFLGVVVLTFYLSLEENGIRKFLTSVVPARFQPYLTRLLNRIQERMGAWLRGQLLLSLIIGGLSFIALLILDVKYALLLALIAGFTEAIPIAGPIIGAVPAVFFALTDSPLKALAVAVVYLVIQQLENNLIVPRVMSRATGLNPIVVILIMLIGAKVAGVVGVILAVPVAIIINAFLQDFLEEREDENTTLA